MLTTSTVLCRLAVLHVQVSLGLVPPAGAKPEADALLSRILGKYGGAELELNRKDFKLMMRDVLKEVSDVSHGLRQYSAVLYRTALYSTVLNYEHTASSFELYCAVQLNCRVQYCMYRMPRGGFHGLACSHVCALGFRNLRRGRWSWA